MTASTGQRARRRSPAQMAAAKAATLADRLRKTEEADRLRKAEEMTNATAITAATKAWMRAVIGITPDAGPPGWQDEALCAQTDPEAFFPEKGGSTREAKRVCRSCDVRAQCLGYALENDERFGIWGGMSERERRRLKRTAGDEGLTDAAAAQIAVTAQAAAETGTDPAAPAPVCPAGMHRLTAGNTCVDLKTSKVACRPCRDIARLQVTTAQRMPLQPSIFGWNHDIPLTLKAKAGVAA